MNQDFGAVKHSADIRPFAMAGWYRRRHRDDVTERRATLTNNEEAGQSVWCSHSTGLEVLLYALSSTDQDVDVRCYIVCERNLEYSHFNIYRRNFYSR